MSYDYDVIVYILSNPTGDAELENTQMLSKRCYHTIKIMDMYMGVVMS
jgi:hypothetical protein